ncbi:MAG: phosphohydrolase, partial [Pyrinomonadaceae bacterium]|nr:phosphohydrolase [Pyrinomonadaceae bacterium]
DTIEDTDTTEDEIIELFGKEIAGFVLEVSDDKSLSKAERKQLQIDHAPNLSRGAKQIKLADKISNIEDIIENPPEDWSVERRLEYIRWGEAVIQGVRGVNLPLEGYFDEVVFKAKEELRTK